MDERDYKAMNDELNQPLHSIKNISKMSEKTLITIIRACVIIIISGLLSLAVITANIVRQELKIEEIRKELDELEEDGLSIENKIWDEKLPRN